MMSQGRLTHLLPEHGTGLPRLTVAHSFGTSSKAPGDIPPLQLQASLGDVSTSDPSPCESHPAPGSVAPRPPQRSRGPLVV